MQADVAAPDNACAVTKDEHGATKDRVLDQDTSVIFARASPRSVRLIYDWIALHKHDVHRSAHMVRHDQVTHRLPYMVRACFHTISSYFASLHKNRVLIVLPERMMTFQWRSRADGVANALSYLHVQHGLVQQTLCQSVL
jgi:hypothetical protein